MEMVAQKVRCSSSRKQPANKPLLRASRRAQGLTTQWLPVDATAPADSAHKKDLQMQAFWKAAEGIRTLDLLHGKQSVRRRFHTDMPANRQFLGTWGC
jgi:hypothetical protein